MKESSFQKKVIKLLEDRGAYVIKTHVSAYQAQGEPDITCCYKGLYIAFELKVEGNKASKLQEKKIEQIKRAGGLAFTAYTLNNVTFALTIADIYARQLEEIKGLDKFDTSNCIGFTQMFQHCHKLESIDKSSFDTRKTSGLNQI